MGWGSDYQPTATGDTTDGHSWAASSWYHFDWPAWQAADDNLDNGWMPDSGQEFPSWWEYTPDVAVCFQRASIRAKNNSGIYSPKDFTIEGYDTDWNILKTVTGETGWGAGEIRYFEWTSITDYSKYRICITDADGGTYPVLAEVEWFIAEAVAERSSMVVMT